VWHVTASKGTPESTAAFLARATTQASYNYLVGLGRIILVVYEWFRSWATSSRDVDMNAITIGIRNSAASHPWPISDQDYETAINLTVDICRRNNIRRLTWAGDNRNFRLQFDRSNMQAHRWFANKACPGQFLIDRMQRICDEVNAQLNVPATPPAGSFEVRINTQSSPLNVRAGAGTNQAFLDTVPRGSIQTIVEERNGWGRLQQLVQGRAGWISMDFTERITPPPQVPPPPQRPTDANARAFVTPLYRGLLDRAPDANGLTHWSNMIVNGATATTVANGFLNSTEFRNRVDRLGIPR